MKQHVTHEAFARHSKPSGGETVGGRSGRQFATRYDNPTLADELLIRRLLLQRRKLDGNRLWLITMIELDIVLVV